MRILGVGIILFLLLLILIPTLMEVYSNAKVPAPKEAEINGITTADEITSNAVKLSEYTQLSRGNGVVTNIWADEQSLDIIKKNGIKYLFVDVGDISNEGVLKTPANEIKEFLEMLNSGKNDFIVLPYTEINTYDYDFSSGKFKANIINMHKSLISLGFDGAYLDIEPVQFSQRADYLAFLEELRSSLPKNSIIAAYSGSLADSDNEWEWNADFYQKVSERVDLIFVPGFDFDLKTEDEYKEYISGQIKAIQSANFDSFFIFGIPTHKEYPETIESAMAAYKKVKEDNDKFLGAAIFAEWTADEKEWQIFRGEAI